MQEAIAYTLLSLDRCGDIFLLPQRFVKRYFAATNLYWTCCTNLAAYDFSRLYGQTTEAIMSDIKKRKVDHIELALKFEHQGQSNSAFDSVRFEHNALPEVALSEININGGFLDKEISAPFMIGAMTGGCDKGDTINRHLAEAAEACRIPMAVGSQRAALEQNQPQNLRQFAPTVPLLGNIGATQLQQQGLDFAQKAVDAIQANALVVHINPLQELVQQGGDRDWNLVMESIFYCSANLTVPVIVKEVGAGISPSCAKKLLMAVSNGSKLQVVAALTGQVLNWHEIKLLRRDKLHSHLLIGAWIL